MDLVSKFLKDKIRFLEKKLLPLNGYGSLKEELHFI